MIAPRYGNMPGAFFKFYNKNKINKIVLLIGLVVLLFSGAKAQKLDETDGLFYKESKLYSGTNIVFFDNGQVKQEVKIKNGEKQGKTVIYFENPHIYEIRSYKHNLMHGKWVVLLHNLKKNRVQQLQV